MTGVCADACPPYIAPCRDLLLALIPGIRGLWKGNGVALLRVVRVTRNNTMCSPPLCSAQACCIARTGRFDVPTHTRECGNIKSSINRHALPVSVCRSSTQQQHNKGFEFRDILISVSELSEILPIHTHAHNETAAIYPSSSGDLSLSGP